MGTQQHGQGSDAGSEPTSPGQPARPPARPSSQPPTVPEGSDRQSGSGSRQVGSDKGIEGSRASTPSVVRGDDTAMESKQKAESSASVRVNLAISRVAAILTIVLLILIGSVGFASALGADVSSNLNYLTAVVCLFLIMGMLWKLLDGQN